MTEKSVGERLQHIEDMLEIQNLMGRYVYLHTAAQFQQLSDMFAKKTPGVRAEMPWGLYEGNESIQRLFVDYHIFMAGDRKGYMVMQPITTPVIEVARDGKTAKGLWIASGTRTEARPGQKPQGCWTCLKYGIDFVKEDGKWKIWHFQNYSILFTPYEKCWTEKNEHINVMKFIPDEVKPDRPPTYSWIYSTTNKTEYVPEVPEPYDSWDGKSMTTAELK